MQNGRSDETFDVLHDTHQSIGHDDRTRTENELHREYRNVTKDVITMHLNLCKPFQAKKSMPKKDLVTKPMLFN